MDTITYRAYSGEHELPHIISLVQSELSEPYVIYTYRYFLHQWPHLSFLAYPTPDAESPVGVIVCKQAVHRDRFERGYIAMLSVSKSYRKRGIARALVRHSVDVMKAHGVQEIFLETEYDNAPALSLYTSLGFIPEKRLYRFYLNGKDAFRLVLPLASDAQEQCDRAMDEKTAWDDEPPLGRLRRRVAALRACPMITVWPADEDDDRTSGR